MIIFIVKKQIGKICLSFFEENNNKIVVKPNNGTGGQGVVLITSTYQLEKEIYKKLGKSPELVVFFTFL